MSRKRTALGFGGWILEPLELRRLLTADLTITVSSSHHELEVSEVLEGAQFNLIWGDQINGEYGHSQEITDGFSVEIVGSGGADTISVHDVTHVSSLSISGGSYNDTVLLTNLTPDDLTVETGGGNDTLAIDGVTVVGDSGGDIEMGADNDKVELDGIFINGTINLGDGDDTAVIEGLDSSLEYGGGAADTSINGGLGDDTFVVGGGDNGMDGINHEKIIASTYVSFDGGGGRDFLEVADQSSRIKTSSEGPNTYYNIWDDEVDVEGLNNGERGGYRADILYDNLEFLTLFSMSTGASLIDYPTVEDHPTITVYSTNADTSVEVVDGVGNAHFNENDDSVADYSRVVVKETASTSPVNFWAPDQILSDVTVGDGEGTNAKLIFTDNSPYEPWLELYDRDAEGRRYWQSPEEYLQGPGLNSLTIDSDGIAKLDILRDSALTTNSLSIASGGQFDVGGEAVIIDYGGGSNPFSAINGWLQSGFDDYAWDGDGINSSIAAANEGTAVGYADNADLGDSVFGGQSVDDHCILLKFTYYGDADLDGSVAFNDYERLGENYGTGNTWLQGDFNYSGTTDFTDYQLLGENFGNSL